MALHKSRLQLEQKYIFSRTSNREQDSHWYRIIWRIQWILFSKEWRIGYYCLWRIASLIDSISSFNAIVVLRIRWYGKHDEDDERNELNETTDAKTPTNRFHIEMCCEGKASLRDMDWKDPYPKDGSWTHDSFITAIGNNSKHIANSNKSCTIRSHLLCLTRRRPNSRIGSVDRLLRKRAHPNNCTVQSRW